MPEQDPVQFRHLADAAVVALAIAIRHLRAAGSHAASADAAADMQAPIPALEQARNHVLAVIAEAK